MATSSNRSPSPTHVRRNPDSRTTETGLRRSFNGNPSFSKPSIVPNRRSFNPNTPANSPADLSRKISGSFRGFFEHKENEKDPNLKPSRGRSPSVSKGTSKNFMAPTISAVSKFTPSPRKKILAERNEGNSSVTDTQNMPLKPQKLMMDLKPDESLNSQVLLHAQNLPESGVLSSKSVDLGSKIKPCSSPSAVLCSLDTDPSLPPYDPKTNYLSPRPQFLHYKPKPRIEAFLNKEREVLPGEGKRLEDSFSSESCSETEIIETQSWGSPKDSENVITTSSEISSEEEEELNLLEAKAEPQQEQEEVVIVKEKVKLETQSSVSPSSTDPELSSEQKEEEPNVSEVEVYSTPKSEEVIQVKRVSKSNFRSKVRSKVLPFVLVFLIACLSFPVTDSPVLSPSVFKDQTFQPINSAKIAEFAKASFIGISSNIRLWSVKYVHYLSELVSNTKVLEEMGTYSLANLTALGEKHSVDEYQSAAFSSMVTDEVSVGMEEVPKEEQNLIEESDVENEQSLIDESEEVSIEEQDQIDESEEVSIEEQDQIEESEEESQVEQTQIEENQKDEYNVIELEEVVSEIMEVIEMQSQEIVDSESNTVPSNAETALETVDSESNTVPSNAETTLETVVSESSTVPSNAKTALETLESSVSQASDSGEVDRNLLVETPESPIRELEQVFTVQNLLGFFSVIAFLTTGAYFSVKSRKATTPMVANSVQQLSPKSVSINSDGKQPYEERLFFRTWPTEVETVGESGPSEMSSSLKKSVSCGRSRSDRPDEVQSHERKPRSSKRESFVSSSSEYSASPSYGSFTTYEKIHIKHGDEEVVTPVRRSSRVRKQIISP